MFIIPVFFVFYSCFDYSLPTQIELEVEGSIDLPIKISTSNWGSLLTDPLKDAFSGGVPEGIGVEIYNVNYGQDVQAFCVNIPIEISSSLNPDDYLKGIDELTKDKLKIEASVDIPSFNDFTISCPVSFSFSSSNIPPGSSVSYPYDIPLSIDKKFDLEEPYVSEAFIHALIKDGRFDIELDLSDGGITLDEFTEEYSLLTIDQDPYYSGPGGSPVTYNGLAYPKSTSDLQSLNNQDINKNQIKVGGTVTLKSKTGSFTVTKKPGGSDELAGHLNIKLDIKKLSKLDVDWDKANISDNLKNPAPVSLADADKYLNWIKFHKCDDDTGQEPQKGIGIKMSFTKYIKGLKMNIVCSQLSIDNEKNLQEKNNIFGNNNDVTLQLDNPKVVTELGFEIKLSPAGGNVLNLEEEMVPGTPLKIEGEAELFQHWEAAEVKMTEVLKNSNGGVGDVFKGQFPKEKQNPIDLSMLNGYIDGFSILKEDVSAAVYLSGPDKTINKRGLLSGIDPSVLIKAEYTVPSSNDPSVSDTVSLEVIQKDTTHKIMLEEKHIDIANDDNYTYEIKNGDKSYRIYKHPYLPPFENDFTDGFLEIINARPKNLVFNYEVKLPKTIEMTKEMFFDDDGNSVPNDILADIVMLMHLRLTATGDKGGQIKYPGMFSEDQKDLLGREADKNDSSKPEADSMFTSVKVDHINFAIDFAGSFFTGGSLFIEKNDADHTPVLFPQGIPVGGGGIAIDITNERFDIIKNNFINPDFWLNFEKGVAITIPRNMGLTSVKFEAKGKTSIKLDF